MKLRSQLAGALLAALLGATVVARAASAPERDARLARLPRLSTIVYVTAHPDDESAAILTYLARGLHARVILVAATRGEGGQNQVGPELGEELAWVRTRELRQAAAGYGVEVRFLSAEDFGYSKSVPETLKLWGEEKLLGELVYQIRDLKPVAVISHWSGTTRDGGGAHHQAAGMLTRRAVRATADPEAFPEQFQQGLLPWQPRYFLIRTFNPDDGPVLPVPVDQPSPVAGKTYEQLGWEAFRNHRSQGMGDIDLRAVSFLRRYYLRVEATLPEGVPAPAGVAELAPDLAALADLFPSVRSLATWRQRLSQSVELAERARQLSGDDKPADAALALLEATGLLAGLRRELEGEPATPELGRAAAWVTEKQDEFFEAAGALAGVELEALTDRAALTSGERVWVRVALKVGRPEVFRAAALKLDWLQVVVPGDWKLEPAGSGASGASAEYVVDVPASADPANAPFPSLQVRAQVRSGTLSFRLTEPVRGLGRSASGEAVLEPVRLMPAVTLAVAPPLRLLRTAPGETTQEVWVRVEGHRPGLGKVSVWLDVPSGWYTPLPQEIDLSAVTSATLRFSLTLPGRIPPGSYALQAVAGHGRETFRSARRSRPNGLGGVRTVFEPARARLEMLDITVPPGLRIGYIGFNNDPLPALLAQLGVGVDMLEERVLAGAALAEYDAIVVADRAYDYRRELVEQNARLLEYVKAGGRLVVEHQGRDWDPGKFAPYAGTKPPNRNLRVTDEAAPVRILDPDHPVLSFPNRIGAEDWQGWVQERGLYFWESWADEYTPLLELADPGEPPQRGALLYARYGQGVYTYCGLALFRQVRAGVPGGVRLYLNLLSQRRPPLAD